MAKFKTSTAFRMVTLSPKGREVLRDASGAVLSKWGKHSEHAIGKIIKGERFRLGSKEKIASVQRSFEKARRGKGLFGLEEHAKQRY